MAIISGNKFTASNDPFQVNVLGFEELDFVLRMLGERYTRKVLTNAWRLVAKGVVKTIRRNTRKLSGDAARSVKIRPTSGRNKAVASLTIAPDDKHWYILLHEIGFKSFSPEAVFEKAWEKHRDLMQKEYGEAIWIQTDKFSKSLVKKAYAGKLPAEAKRILKLGA